MARKNMRMGRRAGLWLGIFFIYVLPLVTARGAFDCFLKIDGLKGESNDAQHAEWIEIQSFSHGVSQPAGGISSSGGARSAGRADHSDLTVVKKLDKATPKLALYCCNGQHIPKVEMEVVGTVDRKVYYKIELQDVIVTSVKPSGESAGASDRPVEQVSLNYGKIKWIFIEDDGMGKAITHEAMWDVTQSEGR